MQSEYMYVEYERMSKVGINLIFNRCKENNRGSESSETVYFVLLWQCYMSNAIAIAARPAIPVAGAIPAAALVEDGLADVEDSEADAEAEAEPEAETVVVVALDSEAAGLEADAEAESNLVDASDSKRDAPLVKVGTSVFKVVVEVK